MAARIRKTEFAGAGCFLQAIGLLLPFLLTPLMGMAGLAVGLVGAIVLLVIGSRKSQIWKCGHCLNRLSDRHVKICPVCRAVFT